MPIQINRVKIKTTAYLNHELPDWPWYLGRWGGDWWSPVYRPGKFELCIFAVTDDEDHPDKWIVLSTVDSWSLGRVTRWIDKKDAQILL